MKAYKIPALCAAAQIPLMVMGYMLNVAAFFICAAIAIYAHNLEQVIMSLGDFEVRNDLFEYNESDDMFGFPCNVCLYNNYTDEQFPCNECGHNLNANLPPKE